MMTIHQATDGVSCVVLREQMLYAGADGAIHEDDGSVLA
jgi:hypothetical protein